MIERLRMLKNKNILPMTLYPSRRYRTIHNPVYDRRASIYTYGTRGKCKLILLTIVVLS